MNELKLILDTEMFPNTIPSEHYNVNLLCHLDEFPWRIYAINKTWIYSNIKG